MARRKDENEIAPTRIEDAPEFARDVTEQADEDDVFSNTQAEEAVVAPAPVPSRADAEPAESAEAFDDDMKTELRPMRLDFDEFGEDDDDEPTETRKDGRERMDVTRADPIEEISLGSLDDVGAEDDDDVFAEPPNTVPAGSDGED